MPGAHTVPREADGPSTAQCQSHGDLAAAVQTIATATVFVSFFYLTNAKSLELRKYTWWIIEATASIIIAIMLSETGKDAVYLFWRPNQNGYDVGHLFYAIVCSMVMQFVSFCMVRVQGVSATHNMSRRVVSSKAFAATIARFCGFSWITYWSGLQDRLFFAEGPTVLSRLHVDIPCCAFIIWMLWSCLSLSMRWILIHRSGIVDDNEEWEAVTCQNEIDASGLCLSFLVSQVTRYFVGGYLPNRHGVEHAAGEGPNRAVFHSAGEIVGLVLTAMFSKLFAIALEKYIVTSVASHAEITDVGFSQSALHWLRLRALSILANTLHKTCGWLLLFSTCWAAHSIPLFTTMVDVEDSAVDDSIQVRVITSVLCSYVGFLGILLLQWVPSHHSGRFKRGVLQSLAMMVGFAWRRCYGFCIDYITFNLGYKLIANESSDGQQDGELILEILIGVPVAAVIIPALYWHISPNVLRMESSEDQFRVWAEIGHDSPTRMTSKPRLTSAPETAIEMTDAPPAQMTSKPRLTSAPETAITGTRSMRTSVMTFSASERSATGDLAAYW